MVVAHASAPRHRTSRSYSQTPETAWSRSAPEASHPTSGRRRKILLRPVAGDLLDGGEAAILFRKSLRKTRGRSRIGLRPSRSHPDERLLQFLAAKERGCLLDRRFGLAVSKVLDEVRHSLVTRRARGQLLCPAERCGKVILCPLRDD